MASNLKQLRYRITLKAPVLIASTVGDENIVMSEDYIPGSALLGMFAAQFIQSRQLYNRAHQNSTFADWFLKGKIFFLNGYKVSLSDKRSLPTPRSFEIEKEANDQEDSIYDTLSHDPGKSTRTVGGFCIFESKVFEKVDVQKEYHFHHQRSNQLVGRNVSGEIFNYECLRPHQTFEAILIGEESDLIQFKNEFFHQDPWSARLGRSKNTEYGLVEIECLDNILQDVQEVHAADIEEDERGWVLTLLSPLLLVNQHGQTSATIETFQEALITELRNDGVACQNDDLRIKNAVVRPVEIENYISVWKSRRPSQVAFNMGSCIYLEWTGPESLRPKVIASLQRLQKQGWGKRRQEGFGRIAINWQIPGFTGQIQNITKSRQEEAKRRSRRKIKASSADELPNSIKHLFRFSLEKHLLDQVKETAIHDMNKFSPLPPGSQISRLLALAKLSKNESELADKINRFRDAAKNHLKRCKSKHRTLLDFLISPGLFEQGSTVFTLLTNNHSEQKKRLWKLIGIEPLNDAELRSKIFQTYFIHFFTMMQKRAKVRKSEEAEHAPIH